MQRWDHGKPRLSRNAATVDTIYDAAALQIIAEREHLQVLTLMDHGVRILFAGNGN